MGWLSDCSESERASVLSVLAGKAYYSEEQLKRATPNLKMKRKKAKFIQDKKAQAEAWIFFTSDDGIIVSCRGTEPTEMSDVLADLKAIPKKHPRAGRVHEGFYEYSTRIYSQILDTIRSERKNNENVYVVGHSLGGAMAVLIAESLASDGIPVKELRTYGQPRVGNKKFRQHLEGCDIGAYIRYVNNNDIVPKVPPSFMSFVHGGKLYYINHYGNIRDCTAWQRIKDQIRGTIAAIKKKEFFDSFRDHGVANYIKYTKCIADNDK